LTNLVYFQLFGSGPTPKPTSISTPTLTNIAAKLGDINGDGLVDIIDVLLIAQASVGLRPLPLANVGDYNGDGVVDIIDASWIPQASVGI
jgi:hypothetical protein